ncbi:MAG: XdhC/CoxF family protein [Thermoanaerobaculia bacterium]|nr:XdhC/CoxF family protein [Thermoanaerobaculia bacterium]
MTCFSGGTVAQALVQLGKSLGFRTVAIDFEGDGATMAQADEVATELGAIGPAVTPNTWVVVATHGASDELAVVKNPAGLDLGARTGEEIALSILAEIVQLRRARPEIG